MIEVKTVCVQNVSVQKCTHILPAFSVVTAMKCYFCPVSIPFPITTKIALIYICFVLSFLPLTFFYRIYVYDKIPNVEHHIVHISPH